MLKDEAISKTRANYRGRREGWPDEERWLKDASSRRILVPHEVVANAVLDALAEEAPSGFQIKHVVGGIDNPELFEPARASPAGPNGS